jgi:hypothetical protein
MFNRCKRHSAEQAVSKFLCWGNIAIGLLATTTVLLFAFVETPVRPYMIGTVAVMTIIILAHNLRKRRAQARRERHLREEMSACGREIFDSDDGSDWLAGLTESNDLSVVETTLDAALEDSDSYLEAPDCWMALAAAEIVAALNGKLSSGLPDNALAWIEGKPAPPAKVVSAARAAVNMVRSASELRDLWEESGDFDVWLDALLDLEARLF